MLAVALLLAMYVMFVAGLMAFIQLIQLFIGYVVDQINEYFKNKSEAKKLINHQF